MNARELLQQACGLNLSQQSVDRALRERMARCAMSEPGQYLQRMSPRELAALIELVVVSESWMFRDAGAFTAATAFLRRRLAQRPERVARILSIPCAGGEEPYSMAMALSDAGVAPGSYRIEGVDLSTVALERAIAGRYTHNAFRGGDYGFRQRHFTRHGDEYQISDALRAQVSFSQGNLLTFDSVGNAGRYDLIFCRNLLIYFDEAATAAAAAVLHTLLSDDGMLLAGCSEVPAFCRHGFAPLRMPGAFALQKAQAAEVAPRKAQAALPPPKAHTAPVALPVRAAAPAHAKRPPQATLASGAADLLAQARRHADHGDYQAAADACHALLAADPHSADAYFILGMVSECTRKPGTANDYWRRCIYLQPDHYEALCHLALLAEQGDNPQQAAVFRQRAARIYRRNRFSASVTS